MKEFSFILVLFSLIVATYLKNETDMDYEKISLIYALIQCTGLALLAKSIGGECKSKYVKWLIYYPLAWAFGVFVLMWGLDFLFDEYIKNYRIYISIILGFLLCITHYTHTWYRSTR